jgi:hypothetical protein
VSLLKMRSFRATLASAAAKGSKEKSRHSCSGARHKADADESLSTGFRFDTVQERFGLSISGLHG